jgi:predicted transcriptional regulator
MSDKELVIDFTEDGELEDAMIEELRSKALEPIKDSEIELTLPDVLPNKPMPLIERYISELYALGKSVKQVAIELGLGINTVRNILAKEDVRLFVADLVNTQLTTAKEGRIRVLNKIIEDKITFIEEKLGGDFALATKKDVVDVIQALDGMLKEKEKAELGTSENTYINLIQQVVKD